MLEILKYGSNKYGVWIIGILKYKGLEFKDIFSTNIKDESELVDKTNLEVKNIKISRNRQKNILLNLEF